MALPVPHAAATALSIHITTPASDAVQLHVDASQLSILFALPVVATTSSGNRTVVGAPLLKAGLRDVDVALPNPGLEVGSARVVGHGHGNGDGHGEARDGGNDDRVGEHHDC